MSRQFRDLPDPIATFERLFRAALESLLPDLADAPWYVRERDVVNLFVFRHLVPQFQAKKLDVSQMGIEVPFQVLPENAPDAKPEVNADIVVWLHNKATAWRTCKPLARIEWKNVSCREQRITDLHRQHDDDIRRLRRNEQLASLNYAVLTARKNKRVELWCKRIADGTEQDFFPPLRCVATGDETVFAPPYRQLLSRPQNCPDCTIAAPVSIMERS